MQDPATELRAVVRSITETRSSHELLAHVDKYFASDSTIVHPMLNSPVELGRTGVKAAYKMLRALTLNNKIDFHAVAFDKVLTKKDGQRQTALLDLTEHLQLRFLPLPTAYNPYFHPRFLVRVDLRKDDDGLWRITRQEDSLPTDFGSSGLAFLPGTKAVSDSIKWTAGMGTALAAAVIGRLGILA